MLKLLSHTFRQNQTETIIFAMKGNGANDERKQQYVFRNKFDQSGLVFVWIGPMGQTRGFLKSFSGVGSVAQD
jgi:hypothetical protein